MIYNGKVATTVTMLVLFAGACLLALQLPAKAAFMPLLIGVPGVIMCSVQLFLDLRSARAPEPAGESNAEPGEDARSEAEMFLWLGLFTAALLGFGFVVGGPLSVLLFVRFGNQGNWQKALTAAVGTFAVLYGIFIWLLELTLFQGFLLKVVLG